MDIEKIKTELHYQIDKINDERFIRRLMALIESVLEEED